MNIVRKRLKDLIPATYNPRKSLKYEDKEEFNKLKRSIKEFGYIEPIIYNKRTGVVVGGHQRLDALIALNYKEVDCVEVDLDEDKEKALNIALNKINGSWDDDKLEALLLDLSQGDLDISLTGFNVDELQDLIGDFDASVKDLEGLAEDLEKELTSPTEIPENYYESMDRFDDENWMKFTPNYDGYYGFPLVEKDEEMTREFFMGVETIDCEDAQYRPPADPENYCVHFFREDYKFKKYWDKPDVFIDMLRKYKFVLMPDFSLYTDYPYAFQIWNKYRKCWLAAYWQQVYGLKVVPLMSWSDEGSFEWSFGGIEKGSVVAVSFKGKNNDDLREKFIQGYEAFIAAKEPSLVLFFDGVPKEITNRDNIIEFSSNENQKNRIKNKKG